MPPGCFSSIRFAPPSVEQVAGAIKSTPRSPSAPWSACEKATSRCRRHRPSSDMREELRPGLEAEAEGEAAGSGRARVPLTRPGRALTGLQPGSPSGHCHDGAG
jgi:hypothetical protein